MPWRIPVEQLGLFPPTELQGRAAMAAGVRLAFRSDTTAVSCLLAPQTEEGQVDLYCDGEAHGSASVCCVDRFGFEGMPAGDKLVELWLPHFAELRLRGLELDEGASVGPAEDDRPRWVTYGSSITHCRSAAGPSTTWPAIVARKKEPRPDLPGLWGQLPPGADDCQDDPRPSRRLPLHEGRDQRP